MDDEPDTIQRGDKENLDDAREEEVSRLVSAVNDDLKHWDYAFKRMKLWRKFARGYQWPGTKKEEMADADRPYVANITMRHIQQRTASVYAKNPRFRWTKAKRLTSTVWDGTFESLQRAQAAINPQPTVDPETGVVMPPEPSMLDPEQAIAIIQDAMQSRADSQLIEKMGRTATIAYEYQLREQSLPLKKMMKKQTRSALICGVSYIKQTWQLDTELSPDGANAINDHMSKIAEIEKLAADLEDGKIQDYEAEMEQLRQLVKSIEEDEQVILRKGIALDYPSSDNIIPDQNLYYLPGFVGCGRVAEQYDLTPDQIKTIYKVDVSDSHKTYTVVDTDRPDRQTARVFEIWDKNTGLVCTVCDGYNDYLVEPHKPSVYTERFWPWFVNAPNIMDAEDDPFPPSDVELIMCQQMEINRSGESLREHRFAARPGHVSARNIPDSDTHSIEGRRAHQVITLQSLAPGEKIGDMLQPFPTSPIDPNLYNTVPAFTDIMRSVGSQEANLGGTSNATATESSIAEGSRKSVESSTTDELDDMLTEMAEAGGQMLFMEMDAAEIQEIVGPGAVWPEMTKEQVAKQIRLQVEAGSSGLQNQAVEVQVMERLTPLLLQMPNVDPEWLLKRILRALDDRMDYEDAIEMGALSIIAMNGQMQGAANRGSAPMAGGASNAPQPQMPQQMGPQAASVPVTGGEM